MDHLGVRKPNGESSLDGFEQNIAMNAYNLDRIEVLHNDPAQTWYLTESEKLGEGTFGAVYKITNDFVAKKIIYKLMEDPEGIVVNFYLKGMVRKKPNGGYVLKVPKDVYISKLLETIPYQKFIDVHVDPTILIKHNNQLIHVLKYNTVDEYIEIPELPSITSKSSYAEVIFTVFMDNGQQSLRDYLISNKTIYNSMSKPVFIERIVFPAMCEVAKQLMIVNKLYNLIYCDMKAENIVCSTGSIQIVDLGSFYYANEWTYETYTFPYKYDKKTNMLSTTEQKDENIASSIYGVWNLFILYLTFMMFNDPAKNIINTDVKQLNKNEYIGDIMTSYKLKDDHNQLIDRFMKKFCSIHNIDLQEWQQIVAFVNAIDSPVSVVNNNDTLDADSINKSIKNNPDNLDKITRDVEKQQESSEANRRKRRKFNEDAEIDVELTLRKIDPGIFTGFHNETHRQYIDRIERTSPHIESFKKLFQQYSKVLLQRFVSGVRNVKGALLLFNYTALYTLDSKEWEPLIWMMLDGDDMCNDPIFRTYYEKLTMTPNELFIMACERKCQLLCTVAIDRGTTNERFNCDKEFVESLKDTITLFDGTPETTFQPSVIFTKQLLSGLYSMNNHAEFDSFIFHVDVVDSFRLRSILLHWLFYTPGLDNIQLDELWLYHVRNVMFNPGWQYFMKPIEYILQIFKIKININFEISILLVEILNVAYKDKIQSIQTIVVQYLRSRMTILDDLFVARATNCTKFEGVDISYIELKPFLSLIIKLNIRLTLTPSITAEAFEVLKTHHRAFSYKTFTPYVLKSLAITTLAEYKGLDTYMNRDMLLSFIAKKEQFQSYSNEVLYHIIQRRSTIAPTPDVVPFFKGKVTLDYMKKFLLYFDSVCHKEQKMKLLKTLVSLEIFDLDLLQQAFRLITVSIDFARIINDDILKATKFKDNATLQKWYTEIKTLMKTIEEEAASRQLHLQARCRLQM